MKILLIPLLLLSLFLSGCNNNQSTINNSTQENTTENIEESIEENLITLDDSDIEVINDTLKKSIINSSCENAIFKVKMSDSSTNYLELSVINPMDDYISYYNANGIGEAVKSIRKSVIFDSAFNIFKESINKDFKGMVIHYYDSEEDFNNEDFFCIKTVYNK